MTWVDAVCVGVLVVSGLLAFARGFVREVLGIAAWVGAAVLAVWATPYLRPRFEAWMHDRPALGEPVAYAVLFLASLAVLLFLSHRVARLVRGSALGGLDRTLGLVFGLARGAALIVLAYIIAGWLVGPVENWPRPVLDARSLGPAYDGATWLSLRLPARFRPHVYAPPAGRQTTADALLRAVPQGRATGPHPVRQ
ncbi:MAG: CvpA family protein [Acetobacteraceae bacterium]|nr:CvpA family protein [Acetobacteraceae bacterium]MBV9116897.1 CvpA family protein [Acetobacteraceae bacterium]MBV9777670.1 CvpA family protein [Acetobacteraceae bacterium]